MSRAWKEQGERSTRLALSMIRWISLHLGRRPARLLLYPIVAYFFLTSRQAIKASRAYLRRVLGREPRLSDVYRHLHHFAATILDRVYFLTEQYEYFDVQPVNAEVITDALDTNQGALLMVSHLGSFEAMRAMGVKHRGLPVKILMNRAQNEQITTMLEALSPGISETVIDTGVDDTLTLLRIKESLEEGSLVGMMADRVHSEHERTCVCDFLGGKVTLPITPILVAAALGAPVFMGFGLYLGDNRYELRFEKFADRIEINRRNRDAELRNWMQEYADRLAQQALEAPYNWFNFYDYWDQPDTVEPVPVSAQR